MLDRFPPEIIEQILGHLPTALSISNVAQVNRKLHLIVSADDYGLFRNFVQKSFPSITTPPLWRSMACTLTSRSRAWDRRSFVARESYAPPSQEELQQNRTTYQKFGYIPVIDSYEDWSSNGLSKRKKVLAFGAGGRLRLRVSENERAEWKSMRLPDDHLQSNDIVDIRLLRPHQHHNIHGETIILRRANREIIRVESGAGKDNFTTTANFLVDGAHIDCLDVSSSTSPMMAVCNTKTLQLFRVHAEIETVRPTSVTSFASRFNVKHRKRCVKYLDDNVIATGVQFIEGRDRSPIVIYNIAPAGITTVPFEPTSTIDIDHTLKGRHCANVIAGLDGTASLAGRTGQVFLSGWTDGIARLHDLRTPSQVVSQYVDHVDDGQILSLSVVGHERFFAGSHQNGCLKVFDMRMRDAQSHLYAGSPRSTYSPSHRSARNGDIVRNLHRDINIFLAFSVQRNHLWAPLPRQQNGMNLSRYRGSVYALSTPSPSSTTLFAGIENHVIEIDFVNTDDVLRKRDGLCDPAEGLSHLTTTSAGKDVLSLSCYEKPRDGYEATDPVLLRKQVDWLDMVKGIKDAEYGPAEEGWDQRWRSTRSWKSQTSRRRWRSGNST